MSTPLKLLIAALMLTAFALGAHFAPSYLSLESLQAYKTTITELFEQHTALFILTFITLYAMNTALALPTSSALTLAGGFFMGTLPASVSVIVGATLGATLLFIIARSTIGGPLQKKVAAYTPKFKANMEDNAFSYLLFLRLVPLFPFFAVNILPSLFNIPLRTFILSTFIGIIPGTTVYCYIGATLSSLTAPQDILSSKVLFAFMALGALALIPPLLKKRKKTSHAKI